MLENGRCRVTELTREEISELVWGVTVTYAVEDGTVIVTAPKIPPPVEKLVSEVGEEDDWLEELSLGITVTCTVDDGTVTVTTFAAPAVVEDDVSVTPTSPLLLPEESEVAVISADVFRVGVELDSGVVVVVGEDSTTSEEMALLVLPACVVDIVSVNVWDVEFPLSVEVEDVVKEG